MTVVALTEGSMVYVPAGKLTTFLCCGQPEQQDLPDFVWALAVPLMKREVVRSLQDPVKASILKFNLDHFDSCEPRRMWAPKADVLKSIFS